jgi:hypothetical protein
MIMKFNASAVLVVAMMAGSLSAMGCNGQGAAADQSTEAATPEESPATAPVSTEAAAAPGVEKDARAFAYWAPHGPPALRVEERGPARPGHFWAPGYYRWNGHEHIWANGGWYPERAGYTYNSPRWEQRGARWGYRAGYWHRR